MQAADTLRITLIQPYIAWEDKAANLDHYTQLICSIKGPKEIVVLPEMFSTGFSMAPERLAEHMQGPTVTWMRDTARAHRIILTGSVIIEEDGRYYNRLIWMQPDGVCGTYDKRHLFGYAGEDQHYAAGDRKLIVQVKGWRICPLVCYDLRFPVWSRNVVRADCLPTPPSGGGGEGSGAGKGQEQEAVIHGLRMATPAIYDKLKAYARDMRKSPTEAEQVFLEQLRRKGMDRYKFRRQHVLGSYIADFVCLPKRFIIEVDGLIHALPDAAENDAAREAWLAANGFEVYRVTNEAVLTQLDDVMQNIRERLHQRPDTNTNGQGYHTAIMQGHGDQHKEEHSPVAPSAGGVQEETIAPDRDVQPLYDVLLYVANWPQRRSLAWKTLLQARAIENQSYCIGVNRVGEDGSGHIYSGDSSVFGPLGEPLWQQADTEAVHTVTLQRKELDDLRTQLPFLKDGDGFVLAG